MVVFPPGRKNHHACTMVFPPIFAHFRLRSPGRNNTRQDWRISAPPPHEQTQNENKREKTNASPQQKQKTTNEHVDPPTPHKQTHPGCIAFCFVLFGQCSKLSSKFASALRFFGPPLENNFHTPGVSRFLFALILVLCFAYIINYIYIYIYR